MSTHRNRRWLCWAALLPLLTLAVTGCHHKQTAVAVPPAATAPVMMPRQQTAANVPPARPNTNPNVSPGTAPGLPNEGEPLQPAGEPISSETGIASWYGPGFIGRKAADGTLYDPNAMTAAHRTLPLGTIVRVTNLTNQEQVLVRINDHGPFVEGRILDLSPAAAKAIDMYRAGIAKVRIEAWPPPLGADVAGKWCVQIGAFVDPDDALQLKNDLKQRYPSAKVAEFAGNTGHWVRIDPKNQDRATAEEIMDSIHLPDPSARPYLIRLN
ncbi:MAG TPA: septal ring lytic transglycosylase RlpA family protein [Acidobacteriaceae bacterium]|nr:septal ring lytic transglycosylase RlpA family protein [Acidobacteriaceae bacterium]